MMFEAMMELKTGEKVKSSYPTPPPGYPGTDAKAGDKAAGAYPTPPPGYPGTDAKAADAPNEMAKMMFKTMFDMMKDKTKADDKATGAYASPAGYGAKDAKASDKATGAYPPPAGYGAKDAKASDKTTSPYKETAPTAQKPDFFKDLFKMFFEAFMEAKTGDVAKADPYKGMLSPTKPSAMDAPAAKPPSSAY